MAGREQRKQREGRKEREGNKGERDREDDFIKGKLVESLSNTSPDKKPIYQKR